MAIISTNVSCPTAYLQQILVLIVPSWNLRVGFHIATIRGAFILTMKQATNHTSGSGHQLLRP